MTASGSTKTPLQKGLDQVGAGLRILLAEGVRASTELSAKADVLVQHVEDSVDEFIDSVRPFFEEPEAVSKRPAPEAEEARMSTTDVDPAEPGDAPVSDTAGRNGSALSLDSDQLQMIVTVARSNSPIMTPPPPVLKLQALLEDAVLHDYADVSPFDLLAALSPIPKEKMGSAVLRIYATALDATAR